MSAEPRQTTHADAWAAADPLQGASRLRNTTVWLSSGNGLPCSAEDAANLVGIEIEELDYGAEAQEGGYDQEEAAEPVLDRPGRHSAAR